MVSNREEHKRGTRWRGLLVVLAIVVAFSAGFWCATYLAGVENAAFMPPPDSPPSPDKTGETSATLPLGRWQFFRNPKTEERLRAERQKLMEEILSVGYMAGSAPAPVESDVTVYNEALASPGFNLYSSGHAPEAYLMDMRGAILHTWHRELRDFWPDYGQTDAYRGELHWRRVRLFENGDLLAIYEGIGLVKLDKDSRVLWAYPGRAHHDLQVMPDGSIYVLTREKRVLPAVNPNAESEEDFVVVLDANGKEQNKTSLLKCFENSSYKLLLQWMPEGGDLFHTNTLEVLDGRLSGRSAAFAAGNILTSIWQLDTVAVVDLAQEKVVWALCGMWRKQHQPTLLDNGNLLVFDNLGNDERSQILEIEPFTQEIAWRYAGDPPDAFRSFTCGSCQRLRNGNTLVTESDNGRAFELTPDKQIVWEYLNPHRAGEKNELIATLFEMIRLEPDFPLDWLARPPAGSSTPSPSS